MSPPKLSVNIDHVATVRQARRVAYPDPVAAVRIAEDAGAQGITAHLRADRRHIQDDDVERLRAAVTTRLNLELSTSEGMIAVALRHRPNLVTLVPESPEEVTTEGGLDLVARGGAVRRAAERLTDAGIAVSLFLDPDPRQIAAAAELPRDLVGGFEINTDAYTRAAGPDGTGDAAGELSAVAEAVRQGAAAGLHVYAGHGLTAGNVGPIARLGGIEELNIGHALIARAVLVGLAEAVREMLAAMGAGRDQKNS